MSPDVSFYTDRFSQVPAPDAINEMLGHDLGEWLRTELAAKGYEPMEVIAEDYGYGFWLTVNEVAYWASVTQVAPPGDDPRGPQWLVGIDDRAGCAWWARKRPDPAVMAGIAGAVHEVLQADDTVAGVEWWSQSWGTGTPSAAPPAPG